MSVATQYQVFTSLYTNICANINRHNILASLLSQFWICKYLSLSDLNSDLIIVKTGLEQESDENL